MIFSLRDSFSKKNIPEVNWMNLLNTMLIIQSLSSMAHSAPGECTKAGDNDVTSDTVRVLVVAAGQLAELPHTHTVRQFA